MACVVNQHRPHRAGIIGNPADYQRVVGCTVRVISADETPGRFVPQIAIRSQIAASVTNHNRRRRERVACLPGQIGELSG
jgi:hypothetical protein